MLHGTGEGTWGAQRYVQTKSLPQHLCLQAIKPGTTEHRSSSSLWCVCHLPVVNAMCKCFRAARDNLPPFTPYVFTECVVGIAERSSSNVGRRSWSITDLHWKVLLFLQQNLMQSPKSELFSQVWSQSKFTLSAVWRKCSEAPMTRHLYFLTFPNLGPNKTKMC